MSIPPSYNPKDFENKIYQQWQEMGLGSPEMQMVAQNKLPILIREAKMKDVDKIFDVNKICWLVTYPNEEFNITKTDIENRNWNFEKFEQKFEQNLKNEKTRTWVAEIENETEKQIVGYIFAILESEENLGIYVLPQFQNKGIGSQLMSKALEFLQPLEEINFGVAQYNQKAINFYQKFGFEIVGETQPFILGQKIIPLFKMGLSSKKAKEILKDFSSSNTGDTFTILMPPPNLTGDLHAGHAYEHYLMDTLTRIYRQKGAASLYFPGVDHAGIQLEGVVDKLIRKGEFDQILSEKEYLRQVPKEDWPKVLKKEDKDLWLELAWTKVNLWRDNQLKASSILGDTPDFQRQLFTLDPQAVDMVNHAFVSYWKDDLIYKGSYMINWSVGLQTALSDVPEDVEWVEQKDPFVTFEYEAKEIRIQDEKLKTKFEDLIQNHLKSCKDWPRLKLSTVRIETKFTDLAVAMHKNKFSSYFNPNQIFRQQIGNEDVFDDGLMEEFIEAIYDQQIEIFYHLPPLQSNPLKLILDDKFVDPNFGTGIVKVTPGHDPLDYEMYKDFVARGLLEDGLIQTCIGRDGKLTEVCGEFAGLDRFAARPLIIKRLLETGYIPLKD